MEVKTNSDTQIVSQLINKYWEKVRSSWNNTWIWFELWYPAVAKSVTISEMNHKNATFE